MAYRQLLPAFLKVTPAARSNDRLAAIADVQLSEQVYRMLADSLRRDAQRMRNLFIRQALLQQPENVHLTVGQ